MDEKGIKRGKKSLDKFKKVAKRAVAGITIGLLTLGGAAIKAAADMEMLETQFSVLLGSSAKAGEMMGKLKEFSASTPFQIKDLAQGTQNLLAFGVAEEDVINTMRMLGDTAGGNSEKLKGIVNAFGKVQVKGKASMEELNMIAEKGIPIYTTLMDQIGVKSEEAFFKMVAAGKIGREDIKQAFKTMTSEGGKFFQGMEKASLTLSGLVSTMKDVFNLLIADIGKGLLPAIKEFVGLMIDLAKGPLAEIGKGLTAVLVPIFKALTKILPTIIKFLVPILEMVGAVIGKLLIGLVPVFDLLEPILMILLELTPLLDAVVELIVLLIPLIVFVLKILIKILSTVLKPIIKFVTKLVRLVTKVVDIVLKGGRKILAFFRSMIAPMKKIISSIGDFFKDVWNRIAESINNAIEAFNRLSPGKKFDIEARLPTLNERGVAQAGAEGVAAGAGNTINSKMENKIDVSVSGEAGGASAKAIGKAVGDATQSVFALQFKKILISAI